MTLGARWLLAGCLFCAGALVSHAGTLTGQVVVVADGDTVTVQDGDGRQHRVRLVGIDAPERDQPFGAESGQRLASWVLHQQVRVAHEQRDRHRRILGRLELDGQDINLRLVRQGLAWHAKPYQADQRWSERWRYAWAQWRARSEGLGLWADPAPVPPWEHRRQGREQRIRDAPASAPAAP